MIDIHNHLLYGVDDGSQTISESLNIFRDLEENGFESVILTPHYVPETKYQNPRRDNLSRMKSLQSVLDENNINIKLYLGNEIYINDNIDEYHKNGLLSSLNNSEYLLIELPMSGEYENYIEILKDLIDKDYKIILAHPERYIAFQNDYKRVVELEKIGVYFQCNIDSITGGYGPKAEKLVKRLLKEKKIAFLATDIHHARRDYNNWKKAKDIALKYLTKAEYEIITKQNPSQLLD